MEFSEPTQKIIEPFSQEWFKQRAIDGLRKTEEGFWDFSDSLLLYASTTGVEEYEQIQQGDSPYATLVTIPEREYLSSIADSISAELPSDFDYIDLGPGTEHKEQLLFDALRRAGKRCRYIPVDVSSHYLKLAVEHAQQQGVAQVQGIQAPFEEVAKQLATSDRPRFVSLGLTFVNYDPQKALHMLREIAGDEGSFFINAQLRDRVDMSRLQEIYSRDGKDLLQSKLPFLDMNVADIADAHTDDGIRVWCTIKNPSPLLLQKGVRAGERMLIFQSLRYRLPELESELQKTGLQYKMFDTGSSFVGALVQAKR